MGLSDNLYMAGSMAESTKCSQGHLLVGFQTKSLDCDMTDYYVYNSQLFRAQERKRRRWELTGTFFSMAGDGALKMTQESYGFPSNFTGEVVMYTHCEVCEPVFFEREFHDQIDSRSPWCEFGLTFKKGDLTATEIILVESREAVREKLLKAVQCPLPDDDRVVQRELKKWREENNL